MLTRITIANVVTTLCLVALPQAVGAAATREKLDTLSLEILETLQSFYPVDATEMGIHSYDHRLADYSSRSVKSMIQKLKDHEVQLHKFKSADLPLDARIDYVLLKSNIDMALLHLDKIAWHEKSPKVYVDEAINGIYFLMLSQHAPLSERLHSILARMRAVPDLFETARKNVSKPPPIYIELATSALEAGIDFYRQVASELMSAFPDRADEILEVSTKAREAMNEFIEYLSAATPGEDNRFAIGKKNFDYMLSHEYFLDYDSDSLLKIGEQLLDQAQRTYFEFEAHVEENHQNGQDSVFVPKSFTREDVLDYYNWEIRQTRLFLTENDILTIPENVAPLEVVETPAFLRTMITSIAYQPAGPFDDVQRAYFYVRPIPHDLDRGQLEARYRYVHRRGFRSSIVHEGYPGHHLQFQIAAQQDNPVRKWQTNIMLIEGWALYCEEMMYHSGLYGEEDPAQWLQVLDGIRFRAARIVADVKLHTGRFGFDECVNWMTETLGVETESGRQFIRGEVRRYTHAPAYQMSYLIGKQEILRLREAVEARDGDNFSEKAFHDALLAQGSIPLTLMWEIMDLQKP
jgi:uncharacterized protein (DUF885 family)